MNIAIKQIDESPFNPRHTYDPVKMTELVESVRQKGVLQAVLVRPKSRGRYELVYGHRRLRAAKEAGLPEIPADVREMEDRAAAEAQIVENEMREDVSPLERAEGYAALVEQHGVTVEDLAAKVGKSVSTIRGLLKLRQLPKEARKALESGELPASVAGLVARVPDPKLRETAAKEILRKDNRWDDGPMSYRRAKEHIEQKYMVELKQAPFSPKDEALLPSAGACTTCPKRTGNNLEEYPGSRPDVCTDPECYRAKKAAYQDQLRASGKKVLTEKEAKGVFGYGGRLDYHAPYVELEGRCDEDPKRRPYRKLVGKDLAGDVVLAEDQDGNLHSLLPKDRVKAALKKLGIKSRAGSNGSDDAYNRRWRKQQAEARKKAEIGLAAALQACADVANKARKAFGVLVGCPPASIAILKAMVASLADTVWHDVAKHVAKSRGLAKEEDPREAIAKLAGTISTITELLALAAEILAAKESINWHNEHYGDPESEEEAFWKAFGIDRVKLMKHAASCVT